MNNLFSLPLPSRATAVFAGCLALGALSGCAKSAPPPAAAAPPPANVEVVKVQQRSVPIYGEWVGTMDGFVNAAVKAQVSGYLLRRDYHEGSWVHPGELLFEIDPRPLQAALDQTQGVLAQMRGQLSQAISQRTVAEAAVAQARSQMLQAQAVLQQAKGTMEQTEAGVAQAKANQVKTQLDVNKYAPLRAKKAVTQQDLDNAVQTNRVAAAQLMSAKAQVSTSRGTIASARAQIVAANSTINSAQAQVGSAQAAITTAQAQIRSAQAQVDTASLNLKFTRVISPIEGIAGVAQAQVGDLVGPTTMALTTVSTVNPIKVIFTLPEQEYIQSLRRNPTMRSRKEANRIISFELIQADGSVYPKRGKFYSADRSVAVNTGAISITAIFPNPDGVLRPGQYARVRAVKFVEKKAILIPQRAVSELQDRDQVAVVGPDNKIVMHIVHMGERIGSSWIVKDGVKPGESVVVEGGQKIGPGSTVNPTPYVEPPANVTMTQQKRS